MRFSRSQAFLKKLIRVSFSRIDKDFFVHSITSLVDSDNGERASFRLLIVILILIKAVYC
jgi:hypothetical protein